jgi:hypothetical protein
MNGAATLSLGRDSRGDAKRSRRTARALSGNRRVAEYATVVAE